MTLLWPATTVLKLSIPEDFGTQVETARAHVARKGAGEEYVIQRCVPSMRLSELWKHKYDLRVCVCLLKNECKVRNFRKFAKCSKNAPKVSTRIEMIICVEISLGKCIFVLDHKRCNLGGLKEKMCMYGRRKMYSKIKKKMIEVPESDHERGSTPEGGWDRLAPQRRARRLLSKLQNPILPLQEMVSLGSRVSISRLRSPGSSPKTSYQ